MKKYLQLAVAAIIALVFVGTFVFLYRKSRPKETVYNEFVSKRADIRKTPVITGLRRVSTPGLRIYSGVEDMPKVMKGLGVAILSTSKGVMTGKQAKAQRVGGEVLAFVW